MRQAWRTSARVWLAILSSRRSIVGLVHVEDGHQHGSDEVIVVVVADDGQQVGQMLVDVLVAEVLPRSGRSHG